MANSPLQSVLRHIRQAVGSAPDAGSSDGELLERFITQHESAAFESLVQRHGPMVMGVCRRVLGHTQDAEDAFQASFLVLLRKASSFRAQGTVAGWLHSVAQHVAWRARACAARRTRKEREAMNTRSFAVAAEEAWHDVRPLLDEELGRLPEKYRTPVVLCHLEGRSTQQAAEQLGWPKSTVHARLEHACNLLRQRLARRGVALTSGLLGALVIEHATAAAPVTTVDTTIMVAHYMVTSGKMSTAGVASVNVSSLTEGVLRAMWFTKLKWTAAILMLAVTLSGAGTGWLLCQSLAEGKTSAAEDPATPAAKAAPAAGPDGQLTREQFEQLHRLIGPHTMALGNELQWMKVPWQTSISVACYQAAAENKPLLVIWHPGAGGSTTLGVC
jgi:RNA polymerase sigma factor (sigma-70 family)